jgi:5-deoxy-glucuronate isomerase
MSYLLSRSEVPGVDGKVQSISPEKAGWKYVGFEVYRLRPGQRLKQNSGQSEVCVVIVSGKSNVKTSEQEWMNIGNRNSVFDGVAPYAVYLPPHEEFCFEALADLELAVCKAPAQGEFPVRLITPDDCVCEERGEGTNRRYVRNILFNNLPAEKLLVVEVVTPGGNWSSYPPHKHDTDAAPSETQLEETYYHKLNPPQGFAFQRVYTDDRSIDETMSVENGDVVMVPKGYHPVGAPHGYDLYYLNVMAGPKREWIFHNDPEHEWMISSP